MNKRTSDIKRLLIATAVVALGVSIFKQDSEFSWMGPSTELGYLLFAFLTTTVFLIFAYMLNLKFFGRFVVCTLIPRRFVLCLGFDPF